MAQKRWMQEERHITVCVDSYEDGVLKGRFFNASCGMVAFESLSQFLIRVEETLDALQSPQSFTARRTFTTMTKSSSETASEIPCQGNRATFDLQIVFRQYSSWQGIVLWLERNAEQSFRSVLELVLLMDSALNSEKGV